MSSTQLSPSAVDACVVSLQTEAKRFAELGKAVPTPPGGSVFGNVENARELTEAMLSFSDLVGGELKRASELLMALGQTVKGHGEAIIDTDGMNAKVVKNS